LGFTLIELVMVILIFAALAITAVVKVGGGEQNIDAESKLLRSNIQFAQDLAMTYGSTFGFRSIDTTTYEIYEGTPGTPAMDPLTNDDLVVDMSPVQFQGAVPTIAFSSTGKPSNAVDANITLVEGGAERRLTVIKNTGVVTMTVVSSGGCSM